MNTILIDKNFMILPGFLPQKNGLHNIFQQLILELVGYGVKNFKLR
jgi:hypothetical protein